MDEEKIKEAAKYAAGFISRFKFKFGITPKVIYDPCALEPPKVVPLSIIVEATNTVLNASTGLNYGNGISTIYHDADVLMYRWIFYKIAVDSKYSPLRAARLIKQNAANTQHGRGKINRLLEEGDEKVTTAYNKVRAQINKQLFQEID